jgi:glutathione S-transferase
VLDCRLAKAWRPRAARGYRNWCWVRTYKWSGVPIDGLPNLRRWLDAMKERPACRKGVEVPVKIESLLKDEQATKAFAEAARKQLQT